MTWWLIVLTVILTIFTGGFWWIYMAGAWGLMVVLAWFIPTMPEATFDNVSALALGLFVVACLLPWQSTTILSVKKFFRKKGCRVCAERIAAKESDGP